MRNKKLLWILVMLVLVVISIAVEGAIWDGVRGFGRNLSGTFSASGRYLPVIVNTMILTIIIYFTLYLLKFKMEGKKAPLIMLAIVAVLSLNIARNLYGDQYMWLIRGFFTNALGIMKSATRLGVFMGSSLLLWWLFNELKIGKEGFEQKLNVIMAVLIGYNLAKGDVSPATIVKLGEIIAIWVFYRNLQAGGIKSKWVSIGGASLLVFYISSIAFEGMGWIYTIPKALLTLLVMALQVGMAIGLGALEGLGIGAINLPDRLKQSNLIRALRYLIGGAITYGIFWGLNQIEWFADNIGMGIFAGKTWGMLLMFIIAIIVLAISLGKAAKGEGEEEKEGLLKKGLRYLAAPIEDAMNKIPFMAKHVEQRYATPEGQFPFMFRKLRVELITHMNYLLRVQVYHSKRIAVEKIIKDSEKIFKITSQTRVGASIKTNAFDYKVGRRIGQITQEKPSWDGNMVPDSTWQRFGWYFDSINDKGGRASRPANVHGWANMKQAVHELMAQFKATLEAVDSLTKPSHEMDLPQHINRGKEIIENWFTLTAENHNRFMGHFQRYGVMQIPHALSWQMMDQNNIGGAGWFKHTYRFARSSALPVCVPARFDDGGNIVEDNKREHRYYKEAIGVVEGGDYGQDDKLHEIDSRGRFVYDIAFLKYVTSKNPSELPEFMRVDGAKIEGRLDGGMYYRQVWPEDTWNMVSVEEICSSVIKDWWLWTKDFQGGKSHPFSKVVSGYLQCIENGKFDFEKYYSQYVQSGATPGDSDPAFDREAFKDPGNFQFRGKKLYFENDVEGEPLNNYPCISLLGLNDYIRAMIKRLTLEQELVEKHLRDYPWIAKGESKMFTKYVKEGEGE